MKKILFSMKINGIIICILLKISLDFVVKANFQNLKRRIYLWIDLWEQLVSIAMAYIVTKFILLREIYLLIKMEGFLEESAMKSVACFLISSQDKKLFLKI